MDTVLPTYIMADDNELIHTKKIYWVKKYRECFLICTRSTGCALYSGVHEICKKNTDNYVLFNNFFESKSHTLLSPAERMGDRYLDAAPHRDNSSD